MSITPVSQAARAALEAEEPIVASILMVDDRPANLLALEAILAPLGQRLVPCASGEEALKAVLHQEFAVILMDVQMPFLDGFQTASIIKKREKSKNVPIIFLTAINRDERHVFHGYSSGAVDYLLKPLDPEILRSKVAVFVDLYVKGEQLKRQSALLRAREREALERQSEQRLRAITDALPACLWVARASGEVHQWNRVWHEYTGLSAEDSLGLGWLLPFHPHDRDALQVAWHGAVREGANVDLHVRIRRKRDGAYRWHLVRAVPERDERGAVVGYIATATDIDDQKRAEEARAELFVKEQAARHEAEAASRAKDEFLATLSHDLRGPLNAITGWAHMLSEGTLDPATRARAIQTIERNARVQAAMIEDLLDVSRIVAGKLRLELRSTAMEEVIHAAVDTVRPAADAKGVRIESVIDPTVGEAAIDPDRMQQVVWNLLSNAIKFTDRGGRVEVRLERMNAQVEIVVRDTGRGVAPDFLPFVFDPFRQADASTARAHGGLGLGLSIVKHLVELHGGAITVDSEGEGRGTTFRVLLPLRVEPSLPAASPAPAAALPEPAPAESTALDELTTLDGVRVMVVEDDADARELLDAVLGECGATVSLAASAEAALASLAATPHHVLVSDVGLPGRDGYDLVSTLRQRGNRIPAVALTGYARPDDVRRALAAGFDEHVVKPVEPAALVRRVARLAGRDGDGEPRGDAPPATTPLGGGAA